MKYIPNLLTTIRLLIIPFIPLNYILLDSPKMTVYLVLIAAVSDFLDGFIARKFNVITKVGQFLDPLADKLLLISILTTLYYTKQVPLSYLLLFIVLEIGIIIAGTLVYIHKKHVQLQSNWIGKIATFLFFLCALYIILKGLDPVIRYLLIVIFFLKLAALGTYISEYRRQTK